MTTEIQTTEEQPLTLAAALNQPFFKNRIEEVMRGRASQFSSSIMAVGASLGPDVEPLSIIRSAMMAASLDLEINKSLGFAWIVPYFDKHVGRKVAQFQVGYKGYVQLAIRTQQYKHLNVSEVYEGELISYNKLTSEIVLDPEKKKSDKIIGYVAYFQLTTGYEHSLYWTREECEAHGRRYSRAYGELWTSEFDEMAMKTVLMQLLKRWGPMTTQQAKAYRSDGAVIEEGDAVRYIDNPEADKMLAMPTPPSQTPPSDAKADQKSEKKEPAKEAKPKKEAKKETQEPPVKQEKPAEKAPEKATEQSEAKPAADTKPAETTSAPAGQAQAKLEQAMVGVAFADFKMFFKKKLDDAAQAQLMAAKDYAGIPDIVASAIVDDERGIANCRKVYAE